MPRFFCAMPLATGDTVALPAGATRHVQVLRLQPGDPLTLFNGGWANPDACQMSGGEFEATVVRMGRNDVEVLVGHHLAIERESIHQVHLQVGIPANERMDWLVEKATELGVASITPLMTQRSVLRLTGERADKKQAHWQAIAVAACEQCGRNQVPAVHPVQSLAQALKLPQTGAHFVLSLQERSQKLSDLVPPGAAAAISLSFLLGPEGGLTPDEESAALGHGCLPVSLGARVLRTETAALAALAAFTLAG